MMRGRVMEGDKREGRIMRERESYGGGQEKERWRGDSEKVLRTS